MKRAVSTMISPMASSARVNMEGRHNHNTPSESMRELRLEVSHVYIVGVAAAW